MQNHTLATPATHYMKIDYSPRKEVSENYAESYCFTRYSSIPFLEDKTSLYFYSVCKFNSTANEEANRISLFYNNGYTYTIRSKTGFTKTGELEQRLWKKAQNKRIYIAVLPSQTEQIHKGPFV